MLKRFLSLFIIFVTLFMSNYAAKLKPVCSAAAAKSTDQQSSTIHSLESLGIEDADSLISKFTTKIRLFLKTKGIPNKSFVISDAIFDYASDLILNYLSQLIIKALPDEKFVIQDILQDILQKIFDSKFKSRLSTRIFNPRSFRKNATRTSNN